MRARLRVDRSALADNYGLFRETAAGACGAVVKADGYGLGAVRVASIFADLGCRHFFVATACEGVALRRAHPEVGIYVLEGAMPTTSGCLAKSRLTPVINHHEQLAAWEAHRDLDIAVHVDTGMNRLGFARSFTGEHLVGYRPTLLMTHLACADEPEHPLNERQLRRFEAVAQQLPGVSTSIGNSAGTLLGRRFQGDLVRPGIGLFGGNPWSSRANPTRPVATLEAPVLQIRKLAAGEPVGYGAAWQSDRPRRLAVLGIGYADGLPRRLSNCGEVVVRGRRCPVVGRVSMDLTTVDVTDCDARTGDWVELFGRQLAIDAVAKTADTIAYELLTGIAPRVARIFE